ncbi:MAG: hypothetical protein ACD_51C00028G0028 [uncultured bacterium]|nr:MAG: hypothetical protein ACD_51C00028G0028 [uncultured bacterium]OGJ47892.1 MAG: hypothetical protein A2244_05435 [Candidatus Peregrinibacteria bacterium RIFOXYA2_FULL_41_18]OGJ49130.1 MAG: hypothetical protein A2344_00980 [Candidatus Peregrinibacteria bacterium RIFOXYB12_FULL_41_12]
MKKTASAFKAIGEPNRLKIVELLSSGEKCVCEIEAALDLPQNLVSHHLRVLREADLITVCCEAQWKHYSLNKKSINSLAKNLQNLTHKKCSNISPRKSCTL